MSDVAAAMKTERSRSAQAPASRIISVDFMRGLVMAIMAMYHSRASKEASVPEGVGALHTTTTFHSGTAALIR
jgi:uncharacterized membrane protein